MKETSCHTNFGGSSMTKLKSYDPNITYDNIRINVKFQLWEYHGHAEFDIYETSYKGLALLDLLRSHKQLIKYLKQSSNNMDFKINSNEWSAELQDDWHNKLRICGSLDDEESMTELTESIVGVDVIKAIDFEQNVL